MQYELLFAINRWILTSLSSSRYTAYLHVRRGNCLVHIHSNTLFALSSGTDCMGELRGHSKMKGLQSDSDQRALEKAGVNSLDFSNGVRMRGDEWSLRAFRALRFFCEHEQK